MVADTFGLCGVCGLPAGMTHQLKVLAPQGQMSPALAVAETSIVEAMRARSGVYGDRDVWAPAMLDEEIAYISARVTHFDGTPQISAGNPPDPLRPGDLGYATAVLLGERRRLTDRRDHLAAERVTRAIDFLEGFIQGARS